MELDNPDGKEFASWRSYDIYADRVRHTSRYVWDPAIQAFLATVIATIEQRDQTLHTGRILFRAQQGVEVFDRHDEQGNWIGEYTSGFGAKRMKPLERRAKEGRANPAGIPVLYLGSTAETSISEVRPWVGAEVSVAKCRILRDLRTLDLSLGHGHSSFGGLNMGQIMGTTPISAPEKKSAVWTDIDNAFSRPVTLSDDSADYVPTQILAELFRAQGYDAIAYKSQFGDDECYNIAVFDPSAVDVISCAPYRVEAIKVTAAQFDNDWYKHVAGEEELNQLANSTEEDHRPT